MKLTLIVFLLFLIKGLYSQELLKIDDLEIETGNFKNFSSLKEELEGVKIVSLGEGNHYMGTTFKTKVAMIKYLHDSLNFDVIAFESGLCDCKVTNDSLQIGTSTQELFFDGLFGVWKCDEVKVLFDYLAQNDNQENNPIDFIGIDNQFLGNSKKYLKADFNLLFDSLNHYSSEVIESDRFYSILDEVIRTSNFTQKFSVEDTTYFSGKLRRINQLINENNLGNRPYYQFWKQLSTNIISDYTRMYFQPFGAIRDSMMYENLKWYMDLYPDKKIILWAASGHLMFEPRNNDSNNKPMGTYLKNNFKEQYYAIVFTAYTGKYGNKDKGLLSFKIKKSTEKSIEHYIHKNYFGNFALFSLRNKKNKEFIEQQKITHVKISRNENIMIPFEFADALFYIKEMHAPTYFFKK
jgi:erythromycin esterase-like protein